MSAAAAMKASSMKMPPSGKAVPPVSQAGPWKVELRNACHGVWPLFGTPKKNDSPQFKPACIPTPSQKISGLAQGHAHHQTAQRGGEHSHWRRARVVAVQGTKSNRQQNCGGPESDAGRQRVLHVTTQEKLLEQANEQHVQGIQERRGHQGATRGADAGDLEAVECKEAQQHAGDDRKSRE